MAEPKITGAMRIVDGSTNLRTLKELNTLLTTLNTNVTNLSNKLDTLMNYSTSEQAVGKWIDGKPIFRKTYNFGNISANSTKAISISDIYSTIDQLITIKNNSIFLLNMTIQQIINELILQNNFKIPLLEDEKEEANNMLKEIICNSNFFNKYLDRYKLIVNKQNIQELIDELLVKLQQLDLYKKDLIKLISKTDIDTMMKIFETDKKYPSEYIGMFRYKDNDKYLAVNNTSG